MTEYIHLPDVLLYLLFMLFGVLTFLAFVIWRFTK